MFKYSLRTKVIIVFSVIVLTAILIWLNSYNNSRSRDLAMVNQARDLATAMERYFSQHYKYPDIEKVNLSSIAVVTENGLNQQGDYIYFTPVNWAGEGSLYSTSERYVIEFSLENSWDLWNLSGAGQCRISNYLEMICQSD